MIKLGILKRYLLAGHWWLMPVLLATGETDQEDHSSKLAQANSLRDPISKTLNTKKCVGVVEWLKW
jgi:hypothetical protein